MNIPMPTPSTKLPRGHYLVTEDLVTALNKVTGKPDDVFFPERPGRWVRLPGNTILEVYEDEIHERLCCKHVMGGYGATQLDFDADQLLLDRYLDA